MKRFASPSWHCCAVNRNPNGVRLAWDGEVPFIRGAVSVLQYDVFVGVPVDKPQGFKTADTTAGLSLSGQF